MRIGIDLSSAVKKYPSGIGNTILGLVKGLVRVLGDDRVDLCVRLSRMKHWNASFLPRDSRFTRKIIQEPLNWYYPRKLDCFHGPDARLPRYEGCALVATFHDVFSMLDEDFMRDEFRRKKRERYSDLCARAHLLFAVSESTRRDMIRFLDVDPGRIRVVPQAVNDTFRPQPPKRVAQVRKAFGLDEDYLLFVGQIARRKNVTRMVRAFGRVRKRYGRGLKLVVVGRPTYGSEEPLAAMEAPEVRDAVVRIDSCSEEDLTALYTGARVKLFTTLYEGFGLPVLEAMACGTPVVSSTVSSMPEVAGDAARLVDPRDEDAIAEATLGLLEDEAAWRSCRERGFARAAEFSWEQTARCVLEGYYEAVRRAANGT